MTGLGTPALRATGFFVFWIVLFGTDPAALPVGAVTAAAAAWTSLRLLPRGTSSPSLTAMASLVVRFVGQSAAAGLDVALRALDPRLPLQPGFVTVPLRLPPGAARSGFCALSSLLPGTVPSGLAGKNSLLVHCLDVGLPVVSQMQEEEALLRRALGVVSGG